MPKLKDDNVISYPLSGDGSPSMQEYRQKVRNGEIKKMGRPFLSPEEKAESKRKRKEYQQNYYIKRKQSLRRKRDNFLEFEEARRRIRGESLQSVNQYREWYKINRPSNMPFAPDYFYKDKGWDGWNDFLGNNNEYPYIKRKSYRPYSEARAFAMSKNLNGFAEWLEFCKEGKCPEDIPHRPDIVYYRRGEWFSWREFLGPRDAIERRQALENFEEKVLYILNVPEKGNSKIYRIGVTIGGRSAIRESCRKYGLKFVDAYLLDQDYDWKRVIQRYGQPYWGSDGVYEVDNIHAFIFDISQNFSRFDLAP